MRILGIISVSFLMLLCSCDNSKIVDNTSNNFNITTSVPSNSEVNNNDSKNNTSNLNQSSDTPSNDSEPNSSKSGTITNDGTLDDGREWGPLED